MKKLLIIALFVLGMCNVSVFGMGQEIILDVYIQDNATLTITNASITLHPLSHILVESGSTLIVDNSTIINAEIIVQDGGSLIIRNNGIIQQGEDDKVDIQLGGTLQILSGEILAFD